VGEVSPRSIEVLDAAMHLGLDLRVDRPAVVSQERPARATLPTVGATVLSIEDAPTGTGGLGAVA